MRAFGLSVIATVVAAATVALGVPVGAATVKVPGSPLAMARNADGRLEAFGVAANGAAFHKWQESAAGPWSEWSRFDGNFTNIAAETNADGRIEAFAIAADGSISHRSQRTAGGAWSPWTLIDGHLATLAIARS